MVPLLVDLYPIEPPSGNPPRFGPFLFLLFFLQSLYPPFFLVYLLVLLKICDSDNFLAAFAPDAAEPAGFASLEVVVEAGVRDPADGVKALAGDLQVLVSPDEVHQGCLVLGQVYFLLL